jgi:hypothetical protein
MSKRKNGLKWYWGWVEEPAAVIVVVFICFVIMVAMAITLMVKK